MRRGLPLPGGWDPVELRGRLVPVVGPRLPAVPGGGRASGLLPLVVMASSMAKVSGWRALWRAVRARGAGGPWLAAAGGPWLTGSRSVLCLSCPEWDGSEPGTPAWWLPLSPPGFLIRSCGWLDPGAAAWPGGASCRIGARGRAASAPSRACPGGEPGGRPCSPRLVCALSTSMAALEPPRVRLDGGCWVGPWLARLSPGGPPLRSKRAVGESGLPAPRLPWLAQRVPA